MTFARQSLTPQVDYDLPPAFIRASEFRSTNKFLAKAFVLPNESERESGTFEGNS